MGRFPSAVQIGRHVSLKGVDARGGAARETPWRTIGHAVSQLTPGDTLHIAAGNYEEKIEVKVSGTAAAPSF